MEKHSQDLTLPEVATEAETESQLLAQKREEDRRIVTPYAFEVSDALVGTPLASNWYRGFALCIDMLLIAMIADLSGILLAGLLAWTFFRAGNRLKEKQRYGFGRKILRSLAALLLFVLVLGVFEELRYKYFNNTVDNETSTEQQNLKLNGVEALVFAGIATKAVTDMAAVQAQLEQGQCQPELDCWTDYGYGVMDNLLELDLTDEQVNVLINSVIGETSLSEAQKSELAENMRQYYQQNYQQPEVSESNQQQARELNDADNSQQQEPALSEAVDKPEDDSKQPQSHSYSLLEWAKGIAGDLGLGFGWAAFYFTVFTAWWNGQTPGKRLFSIKVCKLDGSGLNLWESFGRYGGYGAGLATGLLGFLQIFWDPNRQGIQDKISETLVIKVVK